MNFKLVVSIILLLSIHDLYSQNAMYDWAVHIDGDGPDYSADLFVDNNGNILSTGGFEGTADFDPGAGVVSETSNGGVDIFIQKLSPNGDLLWARNMGGSDNDWSTSIATDSLGNVYTTGVFKDTVDFDPGPGTAILNSAGNWDFFIQKLDSNGNFLWVKHIGGIGNDECLGMVVDAAGNVFATGAYSNSVDFDPGPSSLILSTLPSLFTNAFILKLDFDGNFLWVEEMGGNFYEYGLDITLDDFGNIYTVGNFEETADLDPGPGVTNLTSIGDLDVFIQKYDSNGNLLWMQQTGSTAYDDVESVVVDGLGNVIVTGTFEGTIDFDPGSGTEMYTSVGFNDMFIQKIDANGVFQWVYVVGGVLSEIGFSAVDSSGNIYTTGHFQTTVDFDNGAGYVPLTDPGFGDGYILKVDSLGNFLWVKQIGGLSLQSCFGIEMDEYENIHIMGDFRATPDFDPGAGVVNLTSNGLNSDVFVLKLNPCIADTITDVVTACNSYTWINGITYFGSGTATMVYTNVAGCDSIHTLNLTINFVNDITTLVNGLTITANNSNATYQWLDCNNNFSPILGETGVTFTGVQDGTYAVQLSQNGCVDTSWCVTVSTIGIDELSNEIQLVARPNPTTGAVVVEFEEPMGNVKLVVTDIAGKVISESNYTSITNAILLELGEAQGMYFLTIKTRTAQKTIKLMKE